MAFGEGEQPESVRGRVQLLTLVEVKDLLGCQSTSELGRFLKARLWDVVSGVCDRESHPLPLLEGAISMLLSMDNLHMIHTSYILNTGE